MEKPIVVAAFYHYVALPEPRGFAQLHESFCKDLGLKGRILVAAEGINGVISGTAPQIEEYARVMNADPRFSAMMFKKDPAIMHPFHKMNVKVKSELVRFEQQVNLANAGKHISPEEFLALYNEPEKIGNDIIILDARNDYESRVGKFKGAIIPDIQTFRDFPKVVDLIKDKKDKKIVMYCTGGIRCEKASAYLKEQGFGDVSQLNGGILNFGKECPDTVWEGKCFVFDKRLVSSVNTEESPITNCEICSIPCDLYKNCARTECDKYCIVCLECEKKYGGCCSADCHHTRILQGSAQGRNEQITLPSTA